MKIICHDIAHFTLTIAALVREGVMFNAHTVDLTITLTGGF